MATVKTFFKLNLFVMRLLGFYPSFRFKKLYNLYAYAVYMCLTIPVPTLAAIHLLVDENVDLDQVGDSSFIIFQGGCFIFKLIPFIFDPDVIRKTIYMLEMPVFNSYTKEQEAIVYKCITICKRNTWLFLGFCLVSVLSWSAAPFCGSGQQFPIEIWLPFDPHCSTAVYVLTYIFICLGVGNGAISNGVIDPLVSGMACFAAYQLRVLKDNLQNLNENADKEFLVRFGLNDNQKSSLKTEIVYNKIKTNVKHHNAILDFIAYYENVYSSVIFTQFTASVIVICVSCLQLSMVQPFTFTFFAMILFLLTMLLEIFLYSYFGSRLLEESNSLTSAIYMGKWYELDIKSRKSLIVLMERSKKPIVVTAGKILDLSLETFTTILRRAYSLLAVLKNYDVNM